MRELRQRWILRVSTLFTLTACFTLLIGGGLTAMNLNKILTYWGEDIQLTAYLNSDLGQVDIEKIQRDISKNPSIDKVHYVSQERALQDFSAQMASYAPDLASDRDLLSLIPGSLQISLKEDVTGSVGALRLEAVAKVLSRVEGIDEVRFGQEWVRKYSAFLTFIHRLMMAVAGIVGLATLLVIGNSVRASIEARRSEIEVLELVGATAWMVRRPFLVEGAILGLGSSAVAVFLCLMGLSFFKNTFLEDLRYFQLSDQILSFTLLHVVAMVISGTALGALASYFCVRRMNDGFSASGGVV